MTRPWKRTTTKETEHEERLMVQETHSDYTNLREATLDDIRVAAFREGYLLVARIKGEPTNDGR